MHQIETNLMRFNWDKTHHKTPEVIITHHDPSETIRNHQKPSELIRNHRNSLETIRTHQKPSELIGNHHNLSNTIRVPSKSTETGQNITAQKDWSERIIMIHQNSSEPIKTDKKHEKTSNLYVVIFCFTCNFCHSFFFLVLTTTLLTGRGGELH